MKHIFLLSLLLTSLHCFSQKKKITITIDDLPCTGCATYESSKSTTTKLVETLIRYKVPAIGFVNENKLYSGGQTDEKKIDLLRIWLKNDLELGNHTFSHISIDNSSLKEYKKDLLKGEIITRPLVKEYQQELRYFRHTQLRTGPTQKYKEGLNKILTDHNYITAPVTIDNDEYIYAFCYHHAKMKEDSVTMRLIAYDYINYMKDICKHYEKIAHDYLGYHVNHILLLHANELNADYLPFVLNMLKSRDYAFVPLDEALQDSAYSRPEAVSSRGLSWIYRWQLADGNTIIDQPNVSPAIRAQFLQRRTGKPIRKQQTLEGPQEDIDLILSSIRTFSGYYMAKEFDHLADCYSVDGKIFPNRTSIIEGRKAIKERWVLPQGVTIKKHVITPVEIKVIGDYAYDYGFYEGITQFKNGKQSNWAGKYVIVWKKENGIWKIYLDIWNQL